MHLQVWVIPAQKAADLNTDKEIETLFHSLAPQLSSLEARRGSYALHGNMGCLIVFLTGIAALGYGSLSAWLPTWWSLSMSLIAAFAFLTMGTLLWRRWSRHHDALLLESDRILLAPMVELLIPGAHFRRTEITQSGWHPSLLFLRHDGISISEVGQIEGSLEGQTVLITQLESLDRWITRVELPFQLVGHLRVRSMPHVGMGSWNAGFEPLNTVSKQLGAGYGIDFAANGTEHNKTPTPANAVSPDRLLSEGLFVHLRAHSDIALALVGSTLWVQLNRPLDRLKCAVATRSDLASWKQAGQAVQDIRVVILEILKAYNAHNTG